MKLNELRPAQGSKKNSRRVGRGVGSGLGKTGGRGHKGQKSRSGGLPKIGFEGGQMPLQRRLPKRGFASRSARYKAEVPLYALQVIKAEVIDLETLKAENLVRRDARKVKVIKTGELQRAITTRGLDVTRGAQAAIEAAGGKVE